MMDFLGCPNHFSAAEIFVKINLGSVLAALLLFFVPCLDVRCSPERMMSQNGAQMIRGGASAPLGLQAMMQAEAEMAASVAQTGKGLNTAMAMAFTVDTRFWFFLELLVLSVPSGERIRKMGGKE